MLIRAALSAATALASWLWARMRKPLLIVIGAAILLMLVIVILQSGLGVDSEDTITDSHRPEIVGG